MNIVMNNNVTDDKRRTTPPLGKRPRRLWRILGMGAVLLYFILGATLVAGRWFFTTQIDRYRDDIVALATTRTGIKIDAEHISGGFSEFWPTITLENVRLSPANGNTFLLLPKVEARIAWSSLWAMQPLFRDLQLIGPQLMIERLTATRFELAGIRIDLDQLSANTQPDNTSNAFWHWLLRQRRLSIIDGDITYRDSSSSAQTQENVHITNVQALFEQRLLDWRAALRLQRETPNGLESLQAIGLVNKTFLHRSANPDTWSGKFYLQTEAIDAAALVRAFKLPVSLTSGHGAVQLWSSFSSGTLNDLTADMDLRDVTLRFVSHQPELSWHRLATRLNWHMESKGDERSRALSVKNLYIETRDEDRRTINRLGFAQLSALDKGAPPEQLRLDIAEADLTSLQRLIVPLPLDAELSAALSRWSVAGEIKHATLKGRAPFDDLRSWQVDADFDALTILDQKGQWPGIRNATGTVKSSTAAEHEFNLVGRNLALTIPGIFEKNEFFFDSVDAHGRFATAPTPRLEISRFSLSNNEASVTGSLLWHRSSDPLGTLSTTGRIERATATAVHHYLPQVIGKDTLDWLKGAILAGSVSNGRFEVKGPLSEFPWKASHDVNKHFLIEADVHDARLNFLPNPSQKAQAHPSWPLLTDIQAHLLFEGQGMRIDAKEVHSHGLVSNNAIVRIDDFSSPVLDVSGDITGDLKQALGYLRDSAYLADILNGSLNSSSGTGPVHTRLTLSIPLDGPENTRVSVLSSLNGANFSWGNGTPEVKGLTGELLVTDKSVHTPVPFSGRTTAGPVSISAASNKGETHLVIEGVMSSRDALNSLGNAEFIKVAASSISGSLPLKLDVTIPWSSAPLTITGHSSLEGLESRLPEPLSKKGDQTWSTNFSYQASSKSSAQLTVDMPEHAALSLLLNTESGTPESGAIAIGNVAHPAVPARGLALSIRSNSFDVDAWRHLLSSDAPASKVTLSSLALNAEHVHVNAQDFHHVTVNAKTQNSLWQIALEADEVAGSLTYRPQTDAQAAELTGTLSRLHLQSSETDEISEILKPQKNRAPTESLPDLMLSITELHYNRQHIGGMSIDAKNEGKEKKRWILRSLKMLNAGGMLSAHGIWYPGPAGRTTIETNVSLSDAGKVLSSLNYANAVRGAPGSIKAKLSWEGSPLDFDAATLNGDLSGELGAGEFLQIEPGAGRILSLLSLQHLLKRLTLDFRDVIGRGFAFDSIHVDGTIQNGVFSSPKMTVLGSAASVITAGSIDIDRETLNLKTVVLPSINAGGPSLALALINPAIGIGTFVSQWVLQDTLSNFFKSEYSITGSFDNPTVTKIDDETGH